MDGPSTTRMTYTPPQEILDKYADLLVNFALNGGSGIDAGDVVWLRVPEFAKPMLPALQQTIWHAGGHVLLEYEPEGVKRQFYENASREQLGFSPEHYHAGLVKQIDHMIAIRGTTDPHELVGVDGQKIMAHNASYKPFMDLRRDKEARGEFSWTLAIYGTRQMAEEVGLSHEEYWEEIIKACWLREADPKKKWRWIMDEVQTIKDYLDSLEIDSLHIEAPGTDLTIGIGPDRKWLGGTGRNIPSYEVFISPDWRRTEGYIQFTEPLYLYGNLVKDVYLEFENGRVTKATASQGQDILRALIAQENADKVGEFSLTDKRFSNITKFMGVTLYDENAGGKQGNMHLALGNAYLESYPYDPSQLTLEDWIRLGYNRSTEHTDIVSKSPRTVTATPINGSRTIIYKNGMFQHKDI